ncbi:hypothetical protein EOI86_02235 [Hwanghaeella grinnelliae]|uniref:PAS domain-containing protein n=1 Tax=Hwanghaeella grinnelliae TaxID=2500179 RepID=A0A437QUF6_9PROT|nr:hypothetical protein [Hwanghaeella grinnelliae]RVU38142.1 hypothetical protein EOI86_02235 [Hwanghaeella grinnelliae]
MTWFDLSAGLGPALAPGDVQLHPRYLQIRTKLGYDDNSNTIPLKAAMDPTDFPALLPLVNLVAHVIDGGEDRFQYKLIGTRNREAAGQNIKGQFLSEAVKPEFYQRIRGNYLQCMNSGKPVFDFFSVPHERRGHITSERMYYPLSSNGKDVTTFLALHGYEDVGLSSFKDEPLGNLVNSRLAQVGSDPHKRRSDLAWIFQ